MRYVEREQVLGMSLVDLKLLPKPVPKIWACSRLQQCPTMRDQFTMQFSTFFLMALETQKNDFVLKKGYWL